VASRTPPVHPAVRSLHVAIRTQPSESRSWSGPTSSPVQSCARFHRRTPPRHHGPPGRGRSGVRDRPVGPHPVHLDVRVDGRLPEPVELAAYYVVAEALTKGLLPSRFTSPACAGRSSERRSTGTTALRSMSGPRLQTKRRGPNGPNPASTPGPVLTQKARVSSRDRSAKAPQDRPDMPTDRTGMADVRTRWQVRMSSVTPEPRGDRAVTEDRCNAIPVLNSYPDSLSG
jgi:hypothetical protein